MLWILAFNGGFRLMVLLLWFCFSCGAGFSVVGNHKSRIMFVRSLNNGLIYGPNCVKDACSLIDIQDLGQQ